MPANMKDMKVDAPDAALDRRRAEQIARLAPSASAGAGLAAAPPSGQFKVKCSVKSTGQALGYLGMSQNNSVDFVGEKDANVAVCQYVNSGGQNYLQVNNGTVYRWLGVGWHDYACWGITSGGGWVNPVTPKNDMIYLAGTDTTLYPYGSGWVCWGSTDSNIKVDYIPV
jgi:hypothetical protein